MKKFLYALTVTIHLIVCFLLGMYSMKSLIHGFQLMSNPSDFDVVLGLVQAIVTCVVFVYLLDVIMVISKKIYNKLK